MSRKLLLPILILYLAVTALVSQATFPQSMNIKQDSISQSQSVHNLNTGLNYTTIQEAIDAPETLDGHTIFVDAGTYYEEVVVTKPISLIGEDKSTTIIDGSGSLVVLAIQSSGVFVSGFTVLNSYGAPGSGGGGLFVREVGNVQISDIIACDNEADWGIHLNPNSHNINITSTVIANNSRGGLLLHETYSVSVNNNTIVNNKEGITLMHAENNTISGNNITGNNGYGIKLESSSNNILSGNTIANNTGNGVFFNHCNNNFVLNNTISGNYVGLCPQSSTNITLSFNQMTNNTLNFSVYANSLSEFMHNIDSSNTVNGKPIYYWVDKENQKIPSDAGYVAVINSRNITIQDLNLTRNGGAVSLAFTTNSTVKNVIAEHNWGGISLLASYNNTLTDNVASNNLQAGIALGDSGGNTLRNNTMTNNPMNFWVTSGPMPTPQAFINDVDVSNTVDGKPIYYWVNQSDRVVPSDAGCVIMANSTNITVKDSNLTKNGFGVGLVCSINCMIKNVTAKNNLMGIAMAWCVDTLVEESTVANNAQSGFVVIFSSNSSLNKNWVSENGLEMGMGGGGPGGGLAVIYSNTTTVSNSTITDNPVGIALDHSFDNNVIRNSIINNGDGVILQYSNNNELTENNVTLNYEGIRLEESHSNELTKNRVTNNTEGIRLEESSANILILNNITSNTNSGLDLFKSGGNTLRNNKLIDNQWNFGIWGDALSDFINDVDTSNTVNDKSILYLINQTRLIINPSTFSQVGCVVLVNSTNVSVRDLTLANNYETLTFAYTNDSTIANITATNNSVSILLWNANNNTITNNTIRNNWFGPLLGRSNDNKLTNNNVTNNTQGIGLFANSHNNTLIRNVIKNNSYGIYLHTSKENIFYHNNFINNTNQVDIKDSPNNAWHNGVEGNYWSNYIGFDSDHDGIGDSPHVLDANNQDDFPLVNPIVFFYAGTWDNASYSVDVSSNSTVSTFYFNPSEGAFLGFNVTGENGTTGFCRVAIPIDLLWVDDGWNVTVNGIPVSFTAISYEDYTYLYFAYNHSTKTVEIEGTHIIPEFSSIIILPLFMMITLLITVLQKKRKTLRLRTERIE